MILTVLCVAGTLTYVGLKIVSKRMQGSEVHSKHSPHRSLSFSPIVVTPRSMNAGAGVNMLNDSENWGVLNSRYQVAAVASFWFTVGGKIFPVFMLVGVPLTIYSVLPLLKSSVSSLMAERRLKLSIVSSGLVLVALLSGHYLSASVLTWLHHRTLRLAFRIRKQIEPISSEMITELGNVVSQVLGKPPYTVWKISDNIEVQTLYVDLQIGDVIVVSAGEFIPVCGQIVSGAAEVNMFLLNGSRETVTVRSGDAVNAKMMVAEGRIHVHVDGLA